MALGFEGFGGKQGWCLCCLCFWRENDIPDLVGSLGDSDREEPRLVFFFFKIIIYKIKATKAKQNNLSQCCTLKMLLSDFVVLSRDIDLY